MAVTTWTFDSGFNSWLFDNPDPNTVFSPCGACNPCPGCSASRAHVAGAIEHTIIVASVANVTTVARETIYFLNVAIQNGDTIDVDFSATSDAKNTTTYIRGFYTDATYEEASTSGAIAGTLTLTLTQNKTLDQIQVMQARSTGGSAAGSTHTIDVEEVRLTTAGVPVTAGKLRTPFAVYSSIGVGLAGGVGGGAGNIADISADGLYIYIASFNNLGFPTLIKILAVLSTDGSVVFAPGDGERIGVQCADFSADHVWVAGQFDSTNTVEKSENAGSSFTVKDDGTFGAIRAIEVGPNNDNKIMVFDGDNGDLIQSTDDGATWTTINAAVTPLVNSIARYGANPEEIVLGNQGAANDSIDYSVNEGVNLEDYQTGVYPNADNTKVIVR